MNSPDTRFVSGQRWQTKITKSITPSRVGMSAISKAIRKQYRGLWRVDRALENDRLRAGLPIRHSPSARPLGNSTQKTRHGLYSRSPAAREVAAALNLRIGSPISRYSRAIDLILFNLA